MPKPSVKQAERRLIEYALTLPETMLDHPWGHDVVKVKGKMFASFGGEAGTPGPGRWDKLAARPDVRHCVQHRAGGW